MADIMKLFKIVIDSDVWFKERELIIEWLKKNVGEPFEFEL